MSENSDIPSVAEAAELIRRIGGAQVRQSVKAAIARAARRLGWKYSRVRMVWYSAALVSPEELAALRALTADEPPAADIIEARNELQELRRRIDRLDQLLEASAPPARRRPFSSLGRIFARLSG